MPPTQQGPLSHAQTSRRFNMTMAGQDRCGLVDQYRVATPRQRRPAQLALQVGLSCPAGSVAHALWIGAIRHGHVIPSDRTRRIYKVTFGEGAHAAAPMGRADRRLTKLALPNGRLEPGGLEAAS